MLTAYHGTLKMSVCKNIKMLNGVKFAELMTTVKSEQQRIQLKISYHADECQNLNLTQSTSGIKVLNLNSSNEHKNSLVEIDLNLR